MGCLCCSLNMKNKKLGREIKALAIQNEQDMGPVFRELNKREVIK